VGVRRITLVDNCGLSMDECGKFEKRLTLPSSSVGSSDGGNPLLAVNAMGILDMAEAKYVDI